MSDLHKNFIFRPLLTVISIILYFEKIKKVSEGTEQYQHNKKLNDKVQDLFLFNFTI